MPSNVGATEHHQFYGTGSGAAAVAVDQTGNANCTAGATHIYQSAFAQGRPCTIMVAADVDIGTDPAGYLFARYSGTTHQGIRSDGNGGLQLVVNNSIVHTLSIPRGIGTYELVAHWSMCDDPLSALARSQVRVWNATTAGFLDGIDFTHNPPSLAGTDLVWGAQVPAGTNGTGATLTGAGYLLHETSELNVLRDRVTAAAAPVLTGDTAMEVPTQDWASNFGAQGRPAGPTHLVAASAVTANRLLTASPLVNYQWEDPEGHLFGGMSTSAWFTPAPTGSSYIGLYWTWRRPLPRTVNRVRVRAFVFSGNASDPDVENSVEITAWSCNRNPGIDSETALDYRSNSASFGPVNDTTSGAVGRWLDLGSVNIVRTASEEFTWLSLSAEVTGPSATSQEVALLAIVIEPWSETSTDADAVEGFG